MERQSETSSPESTRKVPGSLLKSQQSKTRIRRLDVISLMRVVPERAAVHHVDAGHVRKRLWKHDAARGPKPSSAQRMFPIPMTARHATSCLALRSLCSPLRGGLFDAFHYAVSLAPPPSPRGLGNFLRSA